MRLFILLFPFFLLSQSLIVESQLDSNYARIGDVISWSITVNKEHNKKIHFPEVCPSCGNPLEKNTSEAATKCININCDSIQLALIK